MRYAIDGFRPGATVWVCGRLVRTNPVDGGYAFNEAQLADLRASRYNLIELSDEAPVEAPEPVDAEAQATIAANAQTAELHNADVQTLKKSPRAKR